MADMDFEVYGGKTFKDLCREVVERSQSKKDQLDTLIGDLRTLIKGPNDVGQFMPRIKELLEVGGRRDGVARKVGGGERKRRRQVRRVARSIRRLTQNRGRELTCERLTDE